MSTPNPTMARVAGAVAALVLIAIATIGIFVQVNGTDEAVAVPDTVAGAQGNRLSSTPPDAPFASVEIGPDRSGLNLEPFTAEAILSAYTELSPAEWADGVLDGFAPEPTPAPPAPVAAAPAPAAPVDAPAVTTPATTQSASASTDATPVQAAPFDGPIVAESVGPAPAPAQTEPAAPGPQNDGWALLRNCESGGNYQTNTGNGFYGAYQFTISTWNAVAQIIDPAYVGVRPDQAPPAVQDRMASALRYEIAWGGWQHWPVCGRYIA